MALLADHPRYSIVRELGAGGMGVVYEALDRERGVRVALKTIQSEDPLALSRFKAEFRAIADVIHPNLVALYELFSDQDVPFFTMELVNGTHFLRWVRTGNPTRNTASVWTGTATGPTNPVFVPPPIRAQSTRGDSSVVDMARLRDSMRQLAEAVAAIHEANLLHRDLKPSNVLITDAQRVVVLDFGLVINVEEHLRAPTGSERVMGTVSYMSPEQAGRMPLTSASDWYSVGVMLFVALTGREPFLGSKREVLANKQQREAAAPSDVADDVPADLDGLCVRLLRRDPQQRPSAQEILRLLGSTATVLSDITRPSLGAPAALVGRATHLERLREGLATTRAGSAVAVHLRGRSGTGKSSLVARFLDEVRGDERAVVLSGRCYERESASYKAVDGVIEALCSHLLSLDRAVVQALLPPDVEVLQRVFPALRRVEGIAAAQPQGPVATDPFELRRRAFASLRALLGRIAAAAPTVIFIDDLQWGDADSAPLLEALIRPPGEPAILLIAAYRSEDEGTKPLLAELLSRQWSAGVPVQSITVQELADDEALELAGALLADAGLPVHLAAQVATDAAGNAFYVHELVRFAATQAAGREGDMTTHGVDDVIAARVAHMPREAQRVLESLAVAGRPISRAVARRATEVRDSELMTVLKILRAGSLVRMTGVRAYDTLEPYHDRVAETVLARLNAPALREHHHRLALAYQASETPDAEALARHFRHAGDNAQAAHYARLAADVAAGALAFARAAELYDDALALGEFDTDARRDLLTRLGDARKSAGLGAESAAAYLEAAATASASLALELRRRAAVQQLYSGHLAEGTETLGRVVDRCGFHLSSTPRRAFLSVAMLRARFRLRGARFKQRDEADLTPRELVRIDVCHGAASGLGLVDFVRATEFQTRGLLLALAAGEPARIARALAVEVVMLSVKGRRAERRTRALLAIVESLARDSTDPIMQAWMHAAHTNLEYQLGNFCSTVEHAAAAIAALSTGPGMYWEISSAAVFGMWAQYYLGNWRTLDTRLREMTDEARERGDLYTRTNLRVGLFNAMWLARDDVEGARREAADAMAPWPDRDFHLQHYWALLSSVQADIYAGDGASAARHIDGARTPLRTSMLHRITTVRVEFEHLSARAELVLAATAADPRAHLGRAARHARALERERESWARAFAQLAFAAIAYARDDRAQALAAFERAEQSALAADMAMYVAATRYRRGQVLGGDEGAQLTAAATAALRAEGVVNPEAMVGALAPVAVPLSK